MSRTFCIDTNVYVAALRSATSAAAMREFAAGAFPLVVGHSVVVSELAIGAQSLQEQHAVRHLTLDRFKGERLIVPTAADWWSAGQALMKLYHQLGDHPEFTRRSFWNDVIIACSCRSRGAILITSDLSDHARIQSVVKHAYVAPYPAPT